MRSSSRLFPVALVSAELIGDLTEDVYLLKPERGTDPSVRIAVTRINDPAKSGHKPPIVLLHSLFCNRHLWIKGDGKGLAASLTRQGYDVWLPELRGHGHSPANRSYLENRAVDFWRDDLPAVNEFVIEQSGQRPVWVGQGWSAMLIVAALGQKTIPASRLAGLAVLAPRFSYSSVTSWIPGFSAWSKWRLKRMESVASGTPDGPEVEPAGLILERRLWTQRAGLWSFSNKAKHSVWPDVERLDLPLAVLLPEFASDAVRKDAMLLRDHWGHAPKAVYMLDIPAETSSGLLEPLVQTLERGAYDRILDSLRTWLEKLDLSYSSLEVNEKGNPRVDEYNNK